MRPPGTCLQLQVNICMEDRVCPCSWVYNGASSLPQKTLHAGQRRNVEVVDQQYYVMQQRVIYCLITRHLVVGPESLQAKWWEGTP